MYSHLQDLVSSPEDRVLFKKMEFHYVVFDEAHMLKNMASQRYEQLMKIRCSRKLLLTGTPLQNNLVTEPAPAPAPSFQVELMSLLIFVMPGMFAKRKDQLKKMFSLFPKQQDESERTTYEQDRIAHAKRIMKPFFLRRLKTDVSVLHQLYPGVTLTSSASSSHSNVLRLDSGVTPSPPQVLTNLPDKVSSVERVPMSTRQVNTDSC